MLNLPDVVAPGLALDGSGERVPIRRIYCVGQNYADHAREMGNDPSRQQPFFFSKPADAVVETGSTIAYPPLTSDLHHEVELVVVLGGGGSDIPPEQAVSRIFAHGVGLDLTRRDMQSTAKKLGRPWDLAKGFDQSAPVGPLTLGPPPEAGAITLTINGELRQTGDLNQMIWSVPEIIAELSRSVALAPGDVIFTGTPAGVGPIERGDTLLARIDGLHPLAIRVGG